MNKRMVALLVAALLMAALGAQAEVAWGDWVAQDAGRWHRTGTDPDIPDTLYEQLAEGLTEAELSVVEELMKDSGEGGVSTWSMRMRYDKDGVLLAQESYNYNEAGQLSHGSITLLDADGQILSVWACQLRVNEDGSFSTQLDQYDAKDNLLLVQKANYDKDGAFISGEIAIPEQQALTEAPAYDPFREEWLRSTP